MPALSAQSPEEAPAESALPETEADASEPILGWMDAFWLGLVEGVTEYLPVSSTGHLILTNELLGLNTEAPAYTPEGETIYLREPSGEDPGVVMTVEDAANAYAIVIQAGAIAAVLFLYWGRVWKVLQGMCGRSREGFLLGRNLILAFLPAVFFGLLLDDWIETKLFGVRPVALALFVGGLLMLGVEALRKRGRLGSADGGPDLHELSMKRALIIGLLQCIAMWPGTSRSMMTIVGGYLVGLSPVRAAEFSFLLGLITLTAAAAYKALQSGPQMVAAFSLPTVLFGCVVAFVSAAVAVRFLVAWLTKHGLGLFAWYRIALAAMLLLVMGLGGA